MKTVILASLLASAAAFAPASQTVASSTALSAFKDELGAQVPLGYFDPIGLTKDGDQATFDRLRYVELKHGRIAMMAVLGQLTTRAGVHFDGDIDYAGHAFSSYPNGLAALSGPDAIAQEGLVQIVAFIGVLELAFMKDKPGTGNEFVGDFRNGFIDFGWDKFDDATKLKKRAIELNNGRAAQMGILGMMMHEQVGGTFPIIGAM